MRNARSKKASAMTKHLTGTREEWLTARLRLHGNRRAQHSIRINDQWRICFDWREGAAWNAEIVDYHKG
jgi:hypothetical protein